MRIVPAEHEVFCSVRANLLGGWTDQLLWNEEAAVVNMSLGWDGCFNGSYPLKCDVHGKFESVIEGRGTGLGISSIMAGMMYCQSFPKNPREDYIRFVLEYEKAILGTEGGWQDQIGGLEPGFKLITTPGDDAGRHKVFNIRNRDDHPIVDRIVLFDTKIRRNAGDLGDLVRNLMLRDDDFRQHLRSVAKSATECFDGTADEMIAACNASWQGFLRFVPRMALPEPLPKTDLIVGHMLLGAGGGGFGICFVSEPDAKAEIIKLLEKNGFWAVEPKLMEGIKLVAE